MNQGIEIVAKKFPIPANHIDYYFDALRTSRGVTLRRVVEVRPGQEWDNNGVTETLATDHTLIAYRGPARRVLDFEIRVAKEKISISRVHP